MQLETCRREVRISRATESKFGWNQKSQNQLIRKIFYKVDENQKIFYPSLNCCRTNLLVQS